MTYSLPDLPHLRLRATLAAEEPAWLPPYKGSMLRGAFGHALRRSVCTLGARQPCRSCSLRTACIFPRLFETFVEGAPPPFSKGLITGPKPYVFEPGDDGRRDFAVGDELRFDLVLLGQAIDLQAYAVLALERMARGGLGARRHKFRLVRVEHPTPPAVPSDALPDRSAITLRFQTPTRFKNERGLIDRFSFRELVFRALRRVLDLAHFHVPGAVPDWCFRPLLERASEVAITRRDLRWHDWERWSNRQKTSMRLGGVVGEIRLEGDLTPFAALLRTAEVVHVGKGTTFGLGKMEVVG